MFISFIGTLDLSQPNRAFIARIERGNNNYNHLYGGLVYFKEWLS